MNTIYVNRNYNDAKTIIASYKDLWFEGTCLCFWKAKERERCFICQYTVHATNITSTSNKTTGNHQQKYLQQLMAGHPTQPPPPDSASSLRAPHWAEDVSAWPGETGNSASYRGWLKVLGIPEVYIVQLREKSKVEPFKNGGFGRWCFFFKGVICSSWRLWMTNFSKKYMTDLLPWTPENKHTTQNLMW